MPGPEGSPIYKHQRVAGQLRAKITAGEYENGALPTMQKMAEEHEVSRMTLINAVKLLKSEGVLVTFQGLGTFTTDSPQIGVWPHNKRESSSVRSSGASTQEPQEPVEVMSPFDVYFGLRLYVWTQQRMREIDYSEDPTVDNKARLIRAAGRTALLDKCAEGLGNDSDNPLTVAAAFDVFRYEIQTIRQFPTLGDALVAIK